MLLNILREVQWYRTAGALLTEWRGFQWRAYVTVLALACLMLALRLPTSAVPPHCRSTMHAAGSVMWRRMAAVHSLAAECVSHQLLPLLLAALGTPSLGVHVLYTCRQQLLKARVNERGRRPLRSSPYLMSYWAIHREQYQNRLKLP